MPGQPSTPVHHTVIVGGGFAGINAAKRLGSQPGVRVTLLDRKNHHLFQPLLYQVAMAAVSPADIATPIRSILRSYKNIDVRLGEVEHIDLKTRTVQTDFGNFSYDSLVLACGARQSYFGHDHWEEFAPGLKSLEEATEIRRRVLTAYEKAEREEDPEKQKELLTFVVVGGGPTGVELAGALGEISRYTLGRDFRRVNPKRTRIFLVEGGPRILPSFDAALSEKASRCLEKLGVTIYTSSFVTGIDEQGVQVGRETIGARTVLWAAGVRPADINEQLGVELGPGGRVIVQPDLSLKEYPEVFVTGDQALFTTADDKTLPGLAPVAIQQGRHAARCIIDDLKGAGRSPFRYIDKGQMATVGKNYAVAETGRFRFAGIVAWWAWLFVHITYLIGFRNKLLVLIQWAWSYLTFKRGARLITHQRTINNFSTKTKKSRGGSRKKHQAAAAKSKKKP